MLMEGINMDSICDGCGIETDVEASFTYDELDAEITLTLCGCCKDKLKDFIHYMLP